LIVGPAVAAGRSATKADLVDWIDRNRRRWQDDLHAHGAILFRGFTGIAAAADFEDVALAVSPNLMDYVGGTSPRTKVKGRLRRRRKRRPAPSCRSIRR
jgi:hypothetical protein